MKRFLFFVILLFIACLAVSAKTSSDDKFINALRNCSSYSEGGMTTINGVSVNSQKQISGWQGDKCKYSENLDYGTINVKLVCSFSKPQIEEIVSVADAYFLTLKYSNEQPDLSSTDAVQNNPIVKVLGKYLQDVSVCKLEGLQ